MDSLKQAHYFAMPSQGSIYTICNLTAANGCNKLLFASLKRPVYSFEYVANAKGELTPTVKEVSFTYIPSGAEIVSMHAFNKSTSGKNHFVIGITIIKTEDGENIDEAYLNIYSEWDESDHFNLDNIAQNCLSYIKLDYVPYQLLHSAINGDKVFLLSGGDEKVHVFKENVENHTYKEIDYTFKEFQTLPSIALTIDIKELKDNKRIVAIGCECGYLRLIMLGAKDEIIFNYSTKFVTIISQVRFFEEKPRLKKPKDFIQVDESVDDTVLHLAVANGTVPNVLFRDVIKHGFRKYFTLRRTEKLSVQTSVLAADINLDGKMEILIGSSICDLKIYNIESEPTIVEMADTASPILNLIHSDLTGDGVRELVIFTTKGVYIYQHKADYVRKVLQERIDKLTIPAVK